MSMDQDPCPCEQAAPDGAPGPVGDDETVIRHVPVAFWVTWDAKGRARLTQAAFPQDELRGRHGKSVSVLRGMTPPQEVAQRGASLNKEAAWVDDPVAAKARVGGLRHVLDKQQRRELCVNADPEESAIGFCPTHASVLRACPPPDRDHPPCQ